MSSSPFDMVSDEAAAEIREKLITDLRSENASLRRALKVTLMSSPADELSRVNVVLRQFGMKEVGLTGVGLLCAELKQTQKHVSELLETAAGESDTDDESPVEPQSRPFRAIVDFLEDISGENDGITARAQTLLGDLRGLLQSDSPSKKS